MIGGNYLFEQPVKNNQITHKNVRKIATGQGDDYTPDRILHYTCFKNHYKTIAIDLSKRQTLYDDLEAIQQINFIGNLD